MWTDQTSLRNRSRFAFTCILMAGQEANEGATATSTQAAFRELAERMASQIMFQPKTSIEDLQGMITLSSWGNTGWKSGGQAILMGLDLDLHLCIPRLLEDMRSGGTSPFDAEEQRRGVRVWLALMKMKYEMAFNYSRPILFPGIGLTGNIRSLLDPRGLTSLEDSRLVAACEIHLMRVPVFEYDTGNDGPELSGLLSLLDKFNLSADHWLTFWQGYYAERGVAEDQHFRSLVAVQHCYAVLNTNLRVALGVTTMESAVSLSGRRRWCLVRALHAAEKLVHETAHGKHDNMKYQNRFSR